MENDIITAPHSLTPQLYVKHTIGKTLGAWIIVAACVVIASSCTIIFTGDLRWAFVGLILLFCCIPMILAVCYFSKLLTPEARMMLAERTVIISPALDVKILFSDATLLPISLTNSMIKSLSVNNRLVKFTLTAPSISFLLIPTEAITAVELSCLREKQFFS